VDTLVYDDLKLTQVRSNVTLDRGLITLNPLTANLYNGQESGTVVINTQATPVTYNVNSHLQGVDANQLLSSISPVRTLYGLLSANADARFTTAAGAHKILPTLNGRVSLSLKDGKVANVDLLHHLSTIGQFKQTARAIEPFTQLSQLSGNFDIRNGVAQTNDLNAAMDAGSLAASGAVDLAREQLNLHLMAVLSSSYSQSVGGTGIGGFLNTALANTNGELVIPVLVTGTFQNPQFAPDLQRVAEIKLKNVLPGMDNPGAFTKGILGQVLRGKPGQPGQSGPNVPEPVPNSLKNLFDTFGKKK
jgi:AsmA protein